MAALLVLGTAWTGGVAPWQAAEAAPGQEVPGRIIAVFRSGVDVDDTARDLALRAGGEVIHTYQYALRGAALAVPAFVAPAQVVRDPRVAYAVADRIDRIFAPGGGGGGGKTQPPQEIPTGVDRVELDLNTSVPVGEDGKRKVNLAVAIVDTGIASHNDLNIAGGINFSSPNRNAWKDGNGHGTHVAGTVGAKDNTIGVLGVAPGTPLYAVKVCSNGGLCWRSDIIAGLDWVTQQKKDGKIDFVAANMSLGGSGSVKEGEDCSNTTDPERAAICGAVGAGIVVVVAAGNSDTDAKDTVPAAYPETFTVAAIADFNGRAGGGAAPTCRNDVDDTKADFSNYGNVVDIAAPGTCIRSTWNDGTYSTISGTSMATPHVTGAVALYVAVNGNRPATNKTETDAIRNAIKQAALAPGSTGSVCGFDNEGRTMGSLLFVNDTTAFKGNNTCDVNGTITTAK